MFGGFDHFTSMAEEQVRQEQEPARPDTQEEAAAKAKAEAEAQAQAEAEAAAKAAAASSATSIHDDDDDDDSEDEVEDPTPEEEAAADAEEAAALAEDEVAEQESAAVVVPFYNVGEPDGDKDANATDADALLDAMERLISKAQVHKGSKSPMQPYLHWEEAAAGSFLAERAAARRQAKVEGTAEGEAQAEGEGEANASEEEPVDGEKEQKASAETPAEEEGEDPGTTFPETSGVVPRQVFMEFFQRAEDRLRSAEARGVLSAVASSPAARPALQIVLVLMQRSCFGEIELAAGEDSGAVRAPQVDHACARMTMVEQDHPGDEELLQRRDKFLDLCRIAYVTALKDARKAQPGTEPSGIAEGAEGKETTKDMKPLQTSGMLSKEQVSCFLDVVATVFDLKSTQRELRKIFVENGGGEVEESYRMLKADKSARKLSKSKKDALEEKMKAAAEKAASAVHQAVLRFQYETFELIGVERTCGVEYLSAHAIQQLGAEDGGEWIQSRLQQFARQCMNAATMAQVSPARAKLAKKKQMELRKQAAEEKEKESQGKDLQVEGKVSKDMMLKFFAKNEEVLTSSETREKLRKLASSDSGRMKLNGVMIDMQQSCWPMIGISRELGQQEIEQMNVDGNVLAKDKEVQAGLKRFSQCCSRTWLTAVTDAVNSKKSKKSGSLKKRQILIFFDACNNFVQLSETEEGLRHAFKTGGQSALNRKSSNNQKEMLGKLGIDPNFGVAQLTALSQDLQGLSSGQRQRRATNFSPEDLQELGQGMQRFQQMAMMACQRASMTPEEAVAWEKRAQEEQRKQQQAMIAQRQRMKHVQTAVSMMTAEEKQQLKEKMMGKFKVLQRLPPQEQQQYLQRQPANDQIDFMKLQFILQEEMHRQEAVKQMAMAQKSLGSD